MIESRIDKELEEKIDLYINGQLSQEEVDELWVELIQDEYHIDYLKTVANTKAVLESERGKAKIFSLQNRWAYAAAAAIALLIGVLTVLNYPATQPVDVEPVSAIELDYYRSEAGVQGNGEHSQVIRNALDLANSGDVEAAIAVLEEELAVAEAPSWQAELHLNVGSLYYNTGDFNEAIVNFEEVVNKEEIDILTLEKGYWYLGNAYFQLNELDQAEAAIQKAFDLNGAYRRVAGSYLTALASR